MQIIQVHSTVQWQYARSPSGRWIAVCEPLGLTMEADTFGQLPEYIAESMQLLLLDLLSDGELDTFLRDQGWHMMETPEPDGDIQFDVPFELLAKNGSARQVHQ